MIRVFRRVRSGRIHRSRRRAARDRASIADKYKWDLTHIYPSNAAWRAAKEQLEADIPSLRPFKGRSVDLPLHWLMRSSG